VDSSISKTINVPTDLPFEAFQDIYRYAFEQGLKGCTTFRPNENITGILVRTDERPSAETTGTALARPEVLPGTTYKMARIGMRPTEVNTVFLTHHHSDHTVDFPCFALLRFDLDPGSLPPLRVFGPPPTVRYADRLFGEAGAFHPDIVARQERPVSHHGHVQRGGTLPQPGHRAQDFRYPAYRQILLAQEY